MSKTVLVTGCSTGIGRATAREFDDAGWVVYATARDADDVADLDSRGCRTAELDVDDPAQVEAVVDRVYDERDALDCLVNNAGYGQFGPVEDVPLDAVERQFETNTFGPLRLVQAVLPRMRERGRGTVVNVAAGVGSLSAPGIGVYTASKYALQSWSVALRGELSGQGVDVVVVEPGVVATDFYDRVLEELDDFAHSAAYDDLYSVLDDVGVVVRGGPGINRPERVARTVVEAAAADRPSPLYRVGWLPTLGTLFGRVVRGRARDAVMRTGVAVLASRPGQWLLERRR